MKQSASTRRWQVWIDTGGTFTDCMALGPDGGVRRSKVLSRGAVRGVILERIGARMFRIRVATDLARNALAGTRLAPLESSFSSVEPLLVESSQTDRVTLSSTAPANRVDALAGLLDHSVEPAVEFISAEPTPLFAARLALGLSPLDRLPPIELRLATTKGTNALLERRGARVALCITAGFGDLLAIGDQRRPDLFALDIRKPAPWYDSVIETPERIDASGTVLRELDDEALARTARVALDAGCRVAAVALLHSVANPAHEIQVRQVLLGLGFDDVVVSHEVAPFVRLLPRAETTVADAYLAPIISGYLDEIEEALPSSSRLLVMTSAGGMTARTEYRAKDSLLSGPAGGVVGASLIGRQSGFERIIAFDMGGTSTDVARIDGDFEYRYETKVGDATILAPSLAIESVAAGGGSVCGFDGAALTVGPESAGASPGPACYGAAGPLTITDVNLLLGRLAPDRFEIPIDPAAARSAAEEVRTRVERATGESVDLHAMLLGWVEIANERMAEAIRRISIRRGYDPSNYALVAFGGAGAQHALAVAERLNMSTVLIPKDAGLLSALGLGDARIERFAEQEFRRPLQDFDPASFAEAVRFLELDAVAGVRAVVDEVEEIHIRRRLARLRLVGQDSALEVAFEEPSNLAELFGARYRMIYGYDPPRGRGIELESLRVVASTRPVVQPNLTRTTNDQPTRSSTGRMVESHFANGPFETRVFDRDELLRGEVLCGPALILERHSATVVEPGWTIGIDAVGSLLAERSSNDAIERDHERSGLRLEAAELELFTNRFMSIAEDMGEALRRSALSTNVKERLDFSCALLDAEGRLVANAPHVPVHLGALGLCVRSVIERMPMGPGDVVVTNHPGFGGSHLPDITLIAPVYDDDGIRIGFVANRAHHAEVGGVTPGSMPPMARSLAEEGVVIPPCWLVRSGTPEWDAIEERFRAGPFPSRAVHDNLADLHAALASIQRGVSTLRELCREHGRPSIASHMTRLRERAANLLRQRLTAFGDQDLEAEDCLDDGAKIVVSLRVRGGRLAIDFSGSSAVHAGNLNATRAIVQSVVVYVLRVLVDEPLPLNDGLLDPVELTIPRGLLDPVFHDDPTRCPAVVGGNVETSQRLADLLLHAFGLAAGSQGTMNNTIFGADEFGYYETIGGGAGAGPGFHGASAVHTHMTNTRITDPEIVEDRYPVRLDQFTIRRESGGVGAYRGGDGIIREFTFLRPLRLSLLSQRRIFPPKGMAGGGPGLTGRQTLFRANGTVEHLAGIDGRMVAPGDRLRIETPGGGGYGPVRDTR
ncbi:MAG: hydantoinase B/oxoprolinase family protein [Phycisphaerales bacterium]